MKKNSFIGMILLLIVSSCVKQTTKEETANKDSITVAYVDTIHTSQNSLDWSGEYHGVLPCADCEGIDVTIHLNLDGNYNSKSVYLGKGDNTFEDKGTFSWNKTGSEITLKSNEGEQMYKVGENKLIMLNSQGNIITGELADEYILIKK